MTNDKIDGATRISGRAGVESQSSPSRTCRSRRFLGLLIQLVVVLCGCRNDVTEDETKIGLSRFDVIGRDFRPWVEYLDPNKASPGYNLFLFERRVPVIVDLAGRTVHAWPKVRAIGRARLSGNGDLLIIGVDDSIAEYDWDGRKTFSFHLPSDGDMPHHDVRYLSNGNILVLAQTRGRHSDYLVEVNRSGEIVWSWYAEVGLQGRVDPEDLNKREATHINSIQEIPENQWYSKGDERFRPGNILVSARNLNRLYIVARPSGRVVWDYRGSLDYQHEALMVPNGQVGQGLITVFNNRKHRPSFGRMSQILAMNPQSQLTVWSYEDRKFFSSVAGSQQPLPNGNILVTSTQGGRAFEIDIDGRIVWQWLPNVLPMRIVRYPAEHCPQLTSASKNTLPKIVSPKWKEFHDLELYLFDLPEEVKHTTINGERVDTLRNNNVCRELWLPPTPLLSLSYGLDPSSLDKRSFQTRFSATIRPLPVGTSRVLFEDTVSSDSANAWRTYRHPIPERGLSWVELCLFTESAGETHKRWAVKRGVWQNPQVFTDAFRVRQSKPPEGSPEFEIQRKQLEAIGYIQ